MARHPSSGHLYTEEEDEWLRENYEKYTHQELNKAFNEKFGTNIRCGVTDHVLKTLHLHKTKHSGFRKGERGCTNTLPIGARRISGGDVYVKIADNVNDCAGGRMPNKHDDPNWIRLDYKVWQEHGMRLPGYPDDMLIHLDGDKMNCDFENLYMTSRKINFMMAKNGWYSGDRDLTLAALKWCELYYALRERQGGFR